MILPKEKPARELSAAMERNYTAYMAPRPEDNELFSQFKYTELKGLDYNNHDGTITRRDPSKVIFANGKYYVWYTHRDTPAPPQGPEKCTDTIPARDWDLAEIWYATSEDGFTWEEQGVAIPRALKPNPGWRSVSTTDILKWEDKYYLYYQAFSIHPSTRGDDCPVAVSYAGSPDGPWTPANQVVIPNGAKDEWDGYSIHDPYPLVYKGKIYLYYKSDCDGDPRWVRMQGLAIADQPLGPFKKHPLNPVINSGHETTLFPFKEGIAAFVIKDGNEHFTIQYAEDGVNFEIAAITELMPVAAGPFVPDAFTNTQYGKGITWGICHNTWAGTQGKGHSLLMRFDCDLSLDVDDPEMKQHSYMHNPEHYYQHGLTKQQREHALLVVKLSQAAETKTGPMDLVTPAMTNSGLGPGKRVRQVAPEYKGTEVHHALYLPLDWKPGGKFPVIVEYTGNEWAACNSTGKVEDANLGYGMSGGRGFIWVSMPYVETGRKKNAVTWWGDRQATVDYCKVNLPRICEDFGGDPDNVFICGFSRGAIAVSYIGLADEEIAAFWKGVFTHDHFDGQKEWEYPASDRASALERLARLKGRPVLVCGTKATMIRNQYLKSHLELARFTFMDVPTNLLFNIPEGNVIHPHTDLWMHKQSIYRQKARDWIEGVLKEEVTGK